MVDIVTKKTTRMNGGEKAEKSQTAGYIIYFLFGILEVLLVFRLIFKLSGANPTSSFVNGIYSLTQIAIRPFFGIFRQGTAQGVETTAIFEPATLVAVIVYGVLAWGITEIIVILSRRLQ